MKKRFLMLALLGGTATAAKAQSAISAGTISVGGGIGYNSQTAKTGGTSSGTAYSYENKGSTFNFTPSVGYFIADNLAIGLNLSYTSVSNGGKGVYTTATPTPSKVKSELDPATTIKVGPYVQYYKMLTDQFGIVGTLSLGYQSSKSLTTVGSGTPSSPYLASESKSTGYYADLAPGIIYFPIPKFGIGASIGGLSYNRMNYEYPTNDGPTPEGYESTSSDFGLNFGFNRLMFSGTYYFGR